MQRLCLAGLVRIDLPGLDPVLLCDGGFVPWGADVYRSADPTFGTIGGVDGLEEGRGDTIPALDLELLPPGSSPAATLSQPGYQQSRVRFWLAEVDIATGQVVGTPDPMFDVQVDQTTLRIGRSRTLSIGVVSNAERLFELDIGNSLSPTFHKSVHPGELGHDNASGMKTAEAWGVESPKSSGGSRGGRGGGGVWRDVVRQVVN